MAPSTLALRFTDENYASRQQVARSLGTNLIDPIWNDILKYRDSFFKNTNILDATKNQTKICYAKSLNDFINNLREKARSFSTNLDILDKDSFHRQTLIREQLKSELRFFAKFKNITVNDVAIDNIINSKDVDIVYSPIVNYYKALLVLNDDEVLLADDEFLAKYLQILLHTDELTMFYRTSEIKSANSKVMINREYSGAPVVMIEDIMSSLFNFIGRNDIPTFVKLAICIYMFNYVKPFEDYNDELCLLTARVILRKNYRNLADFVTLSSLKSESKDKIAAATKEAQLTHDLTYVVMAILSVFDTTLTNCCDRIIQLTMTGLQESRLMGEDKDEIKKEFNIDKPVVKKDVHPVVKSITKNVNNINTRIYTTEDTKISEKELKRMTEELLEIDPELKKGQAHFYIRHCVSGRYYTIDQYKKAEGCVYETARTSMDKLATLGYYKREQIKNKFVYTPISK